MGSGQGVRRFFTSRRGAAVVVVVAILVVLIGWVGENAYAARWIGTHCPSASVEGPPPPGTRDVEFAPGLHAWYTPASPGRATIIMVHGYQGDRRDFAPFASAMQARGYGTFRILLACAHSSARYGGGSPEAKETVQAVRYVQTLSTAPRVLFGFSAGGTSALLAADKGAPVAAIVTDSAPSNLINIGRYLTFPRWFYWLTPKIYSLVNGGGHLVNLEQDLKRPFPVPVLVIQGEADTYVNPDNGPRLARLTHGQLWLVPGANHGQSFQVQTQAYIDRVATFIHTETGT